MRDCPNCKIKVGEPYTHCPICQNELLYFDIKDVKEDIPFFPVDQGKKSLERRALAFKIQLFSVMVVCLLCLAVDFIFDIHGEEHWSFCVLLYGLCAEVVLTNFMKKKLQVIKLINIVAVMTAIATFFSSWYLGYLMIGFGYILPSFILITLVGNSIVAMFEFDGNTLAYALGNIAIAVIPWVMFRIIIGPPSLMWNIDFVLSIIALLAFLIFRSGKVIAEVQKRLSV